MRLLQTTEYGVLPRYGIDPRVWRRLQRCDERPLRSGRPTVFDWSYSDVVRAKNYVGVVQIPGLTIEILPKIDSADDGDNVSETPHRQLARHNLLYMLAFTGHLPVREKSLASLHLRKLPLLEALILVFAEQLLDELRRGLDFSYVAIQDNTRHLKGKLLLKQHIRKNVVHRERLYVGYDEFLCDTWLNRIFKSCCIRLLGLARFSKTQRLIEEAIACFSEVEEVDIGLHHFDRVHLNRNSERFAPMLEFCRILTMGRSPSPSRGRTPVYSLLFPMERLFEEFIGCYLVRHASSLGLDRRRIHIQSRNRQCWLLEAEDGKSVVRLRPDVVIEDADNRCRMVIDTKWKCLSADRATGIGGVAQSDLYQLYAYANRYGSSENILLYPGRKGVDSQWFRLAGDHCKSIRIETIDLNRDIQADREGFHSDLRRILSHRSFPDKNVGPGVVTQ